VASNDKRERERAYAIIIHASRALTITLCVRIVSGSSSCVVAAMYRPGSAAVTAAFVSEMSDVLDRISTFAVPVMLVGDVNIRFDRPTDVDAVQFTELLAAHGFANHVTSSTHDLGGMLDVVVSRVDLPSLLVGAHDVGLSDHRLLQWSAQLMWPAPVDDHQSTMGTT